MEKKKPVLEEKNTFHPRNPHKARYDFKVLTTVLPALEAFVVLNKYGNQTIDFANPEAVKALNKALLMCFYQINFWDIPEGYLCPPIPGRADYIHYAADLLATTNHQIIPKGKKINVLDIGVGANLIYPIIGTSAYGWKFVGSDIDDGAVRTAKSIVMANPVLANNVDIRQQSNKTAIFKGIIKKGDKFHLTVCNPPFHSSAEEANAGSQRKNRNLGNKNYNKPVLNFGGKSNELWIQGGEIAFISNMITESTLFKTQVLWFSTLVSKSENLGQIYAMLNRVEATEVRTNEMSTGNKITRIVAWTFLTPTQQQAWKI